MEQLIQDWLAQEIEKTNRQIMRLRAKNEAYKLHAAKLCRYDGTCGRLKAYTVSEATIKRHTRRSFTAVRVRHELPD